MNDYFFAENFITLRPNVKESPENFDLYIFWH